MKPVKVTIANTVPGADEPADVQSAALRPLNFQQLRRLEAVRLSHAGYTIDRIAAQLAVCRSTIAFWLRVRETQGMDRLLEGRTRSLLRPRFRPTRLSMLFQGIDAEIARDARKIREWVFARHRIRLSLNMIERILKSRGAVGASLIKKSLRSTPQLAVVPAAPLAPKLPVAAAQAAPSRERVRVAA